MHSLSILNTYLFLDPFLIPGVTLGKADSRKTRISHSNNYKTQRGWELGLGEVFLRALTPTNPLYQLCGTFTTRSLKPYSHETLHMRI